MVHVLFQTDSHYRVNRRRIRKLISTVLSQKRVKGTVEVSIRIAGDRLLHKLNKEYRSLDKPANILTFPLQETRSFVDAPDNVLRLGDIVISYPQVIKTAAEENKLVDDTIDELILHGLSHLLGTYS